MRSWDADRIARASGSRLLARTGSGGSSRPRGGATPGTGSGGSSGSGGAAQPGPRGVSIDSRTTAPGELFVGLRGERDDGGEHAGDALRAGAWGVLVREEHARDAAAVGEAVRLGAGADDATAAGDGAGVVLAHADPLQGLHALAAAWRAELAAGGTKVVAITGSTGKTSTKDILAALLAERVRTVASPENLNTEIGMPLALLGAPAGTRALVLELAMRGAGQIAQLTAIARPDVGVIVNVGPVHLELLGSLEAIAAAKGELIAGLAPGASVVVPAQEPLLVSHLRDELQTITFGAGGDVELADARAANEGEIVISVREPDGGGEPDERGGRIEVTREITLRPNFHQAHNLRNLLAAVAAARALGLSPEGRVDVRFSALRGELVQLPGDVVLINDCYNANPMSMRAAIDELAETASGRRVAVLGDMLELGPSAERLHREIGAHAAARGVSLLVTVGPLAAAITAEFDGEAHGANDAGEAVELLGRLLHEGDTVLVKGSRGVGLERVAEALSGGEQTPGVERSHVGERPPVREAADRARNGGLFAGSRRR